MTTPDHIIAELRRRIDHAAKQGVHVILTVSEARMLLQLVPGEEEET